MTTSLDYTEPIGPYFDLTARSEYLSRKGAVLISYRSWNTWARS